MWQARGWYILSWLLLLVSCLTTSAEQGKIAIAAGSDNIHVNQIGFYPDGPKLAIIQDSAAKVYQLQRLSDSTIVLSGSLSEGEIWEYSGKWVKQADFSSWKLRGSYRIIIPGVGSSPAFNIRDHIYMPLHKAVLKSYYFQRASLDILPAFGGKWARTAGHADREVIVHASAASSLRPEGTIIACPKGWYDAGDYGKYVPNANFATSVLLSLYERFPAVYDTLDLNIPESYNDLPDVLDEGLWSLRWLLSMQEPEEGFVYHKLTTAGHAPKCMPGEDTGKRYVIGKSTGATLGFAAVMAQAARILKPLRPAFSDSCLNASLLAWRWGIANPGVSFQNPADIHTGLYKDDTFSDEMGWAAAELFLSTGEAEFLKKALPLLGTVYNPPGWRDVIPLAWMSLLHHRDRLPEADRKYLTKQLLELANRFMDHALNESPYSIPLGRSKWDFIWGSNGIHASMGMVLMAAYELNADPAYLEISCSILDYLLGRNATAFCFVTDFGSKSPHNPHHRPSASDGLDDPVPGMLVGGPQGEPKGDGCVYPENRPANAYLDSWCSYTTNEICINWNASLAYLSGILEAVQVKK